MHEEVNIIYVDVIDVDIVDVVIINVNVILVKPNLVSIRYKYKSYSSMDYIIFQRFFPRNIISI